MLVQRLRILSTSNRSSDCQSSLNEIINRSLAFGDFELSRFVYGRTITQKTFAIPFDEHLGLPPQSYSLLLESWMTQLATSEPIHEGMDKLRRIFGISVAVDNAERILDRVGANTEYFQDNLPPVEVTTKKELHVPQASSMATICGYLERNANKMQYNEYLAKGYPISSGFIEGACRHVVKDRRERSGMRWSVPGAQKNCNHAKLGKTA